MDAVFDLFAQLLDPNWVLQNGGLYLVVAILFTETGVFFGFVLPGDPLLFISGMIIAGAGESAHIFGSPVLNYIFWATLFSCAAIAGNFFGYWFGYRFKHLLNREKDGWLIKKKHIESANEFYEKRGGFAIAIARFVPIVRTFAPIVGGMVKMDLKKFAFYNILGALIWVVSLTMAGYLLGDHPWVEANLEWVILALVVVVTLPVILKMFKKKPATK